MVASGAALAQVEQGKADAMRKVMAAYGERAVEAKHREAWKGFLDLSREHKGDYELQIWCARTAYYYAHRRVQAKDEDGCAMVAKTGIECARRALGLRRKDFDARYWLLMNRVKVGAGMNVVSALRAVKPLKGELERLVADGPDRFEGHMFLGMMYRELPSFVSWGDDDKAMEHVRKAERSAPRNPDVLLEIAECHLNQGNVEMAKAYFRKVARSETPKHLEWETWDARMWARKRLKEIE